MTCIAAVVHQGRVHMGADRAGSSGGILTVRADPKVFKVGEFVIGFTSSFRMGNLLRFKFKPPAIEGDLDEYMVCHFVEALRVLYREGGFGQTVNGVETGGLFLVGVRGRLFVIAGDFQVGCPLAEYDAVGSGSSHAEGSLWTTSGMPLEPRKRLDLALRAAEQHCTEVRGPFVFEEI